MARTGYGLLAVTAIHASHGAVSGGEASKRRVRFARGNVKSQGVSKRVLFVSYHYPPDSEIGAKRAARLAKYLTESGWRVGVLTVKERFYERLDRSYDVAGIDVHRTGMFQSVRFMLPHVKGLLARLKRAGRGNGGEQVPVSGTGVRVQESGAPVSGTGVRVQESGAPVSEPGSPGAEPRVRGGCFSWIRRFILSMIWLPDDRQGWVPFGLRRLLGLLAAYPLVYSSSPPRSTHLIPLFASYLARKLTWVAEFRDPWTSVPKPAYMRSRIGDWLEGRWEAAVMARSARVVVVTEAMKRDMGDKYPSRADKIRLYSNGFDRDEFSPLKDSAGPPADGTKTFVYAGQFDYGRNPRTFLQALSELIDDGSLAREKVRVVLMSNTDIDGESVEEMVRECRLENVVRCTGYVPHDQCMREMSRADVLLLFSIDQPLQVPAKLYEYLALNRRILSVSTGGITAELIDRTGSGMNVKPDDMRGMKDAIVALASGGGPPRNEHEVERFDMRSVAGALSDDLDGLTEDA